MTKTRFDLARVRWKALPRSERVSAIMLVMVAASLAIMAIVLILLLSANHRAIQSEAERLREGERRTRAAIDELVALLGSELEAQLAQHDKRSAKAHREQVFEIRTIDENGETRRVVVPIEGEHEHHHHPGEVRHEHHHHHHHHQPECSTSAGPLCVKGE